MTNALLEDVSELVYRGTVCGSKVYGTRDGRFTAEAYSIHADGSEPGKYWALEVYRSRHDLIHPIVTLRADGIKHAQQLIAWFVWAEQKGM